MTREVDWCKNNKLMEVFKSHLLNNFNILPFWASFKEARKNQPLFFQQRNQKNLGMSLDIIFANGGFVI